MKVEELLPMLKGVRKTSNGWDAHCPAHDDDKASLGISEGKNQCILLRCRAGCFTETVVAKLKLTMADLMPDRTNRGYGDPRYHRWDARDASSGEVVAVHARCDRPGQDKDMWWERPDGRRGLGGLKTADLALYAVDQLGDLETVAVGEGEKTADALIKQGIAAAATVTGASITPCDDALRPLLGRHIILWPDNDKEGHAHMRRIGTRLLELGLDEDNLHIIIWGTEKGDDAADAVARGENLREIMDQAVAWREWAEPSADETSQNRSSSRCDKSLNNNSLNSISGVSSVLSASAASAVEKRPIPPWQPFPLETFPEQALSYVREGAAAIGCDPVMIALPVLAMLGASIGLTRRIQLKKSWCAPPTIWGAVIAKSGTLKSPAQELGLRPLMLVQNHAMTDYKERLTEFRVKLDEWKNCKKSERGPRPEAPIATRYICSDVTTEGLAPILEVNLRGILVVADELAAWIGGFDQYRAGGKGSDGPRWLSLHRAGPLIIDRKTSPTIYIPRTTASVIGGIQPEIARRMLSGEALDSGLVARLLLVAPPIRPKRWTEATTSSATVEAMEQAVHNLILIRPTIEGDEIRSLDLPLSPEAGDLWGTWYNRNAERLANAGGPFASALAKIEEYAARFALIIELAGSPAPGAVSQVGASALEAGTHLADWFAYEADRVYLMMSETLEQRADRELLDLIARRPGGVTPRDLVRSGHRYDGPGGTERAVEDLRRLVETGRIIAEDRATGPRGGRPTTVFRIAPGTSLAPADTADADETSQHAESTVITSNDKEIEQNQDSSSPEVSSAGHPTKAGDSSAPPVEDTEWTV